MLPETHSYVPEEELDGREVELDGPEDAFFDDKIITEFIQATRGNSSDEDIESQFDAL